MLGSLSVPEHPTGATFFDRYVDQAIAGEATPCLELRADAWIPADHGHEVALTAAAARSYQIRQEARGKCLGTGVEFNARVRSHAVYYSFCLRKSNTFWVLEARGGPAADRVGFNVDGNDRRSGRLARRRHRRQPDRHQHPCPHVDSLARDWAGAAAS